MTAELTLQIRQAFKIVSASNARSKGSWETVFYADAMAFHCKYGLNRECDIMLYGILHAYKTGRLTATAEIKLRDLSAWRFAKLLADVIDNCKVQSEVSAYLNKWGR